MEENTVFKEIKKRLSGIKAVSKEKGICYILRVAFVMFKQYIVSRIEQLYRLWQPLYYYFYSRVLNKPLILVIGDSHTRAFEGNKLFVVHHIGPATAYNLKKKRNTTNSREKLFRIVNNLNRKRDIVILVFGEIDCRIHIFNQYKKNSGKFTITQLIEKTISNYGHVLKQLDEMGIIFFVYGIPPAAKQKNVYGYPFYAPPDIRVKIYKEFNERLKEFCKENGYNYIDIQSKVTDEKGFTLNEYADGDVHLNSDIMKFVKRRLKESGYYDT